MNFKMCNLKIPFFYKRINKDKQHESVDVKYYMTRKDFLEDLNKFNRVGNGIWVYYEITQREYEDIVRK